MKVPISWLKDYVDINISVEELAERLTLAGLEVTGMQYIGVEGADLAWAVAPLALGMQKGQHIFRIRDFVMRLRRGCWHLWSIERTADSLSHWQLHLAASEQIEDGILQIRLRSAG